MMNNFIKSFVLMMADNAMILGQRLGELCGHGPVLEQDIAVTNISLDLIGEARLYYQYLAKEESKREDDYPMSRHVVEFKNAILVEQPNGHWGDTIVRQFLYDCYHYHLLKGLQHSNNEILASIANKSVKEATYHLTFSTEWVVRLGDGTEESHQKIQTSFDSLYPFFGEFFVPEAFEVECMAMGVMPNLDLIKEEATLKIISTLERATLRPLSDNVYVRKGGKHGIHSEYLGYILSDMQFLQRSYPGVSW